MPNKNNHLLLFLTANIALLAFLTSGGPVLLPDSQGYLSLDKLRGFPYPLLLAALHSIMPKYFLSLTALVQTAGVMCAAMLLCRELAARLRWNPGISLLAYGIALLPLFDSTLCSACQNIGNTIGTEGIAYAAFLLVCAAGFRALCEPQLKILLILAFGTAFCAAIRPQLLFAYPVFVSILLALRCAKTTSTLKLSVSLLALLLFHASFGLAQNLYSGSAINPFMRQQLLTTALYVCEPGEAELFISSPHYRTIKKVFARMGELNAFAGERHRYQRSLAEHHGLGFDPICWNALHQSFVMDIGPELAEKERLKLLKQAYGEMLKTLLPLKWKPLLKTYAMILWQNTSLTLLSVFGFMFFFLRVYDTSRPENLFALMAWLCAALNLLTLAFSATVEPRYLIYTHPPVLLSLLAIFNSRKQARR